MKQRASVHGAILLLSSVVLAALGSGAQPEVDRCGVHTILSERIDALSSCERIDGDHVVSVTVRNDYTGSDLRLVSLTLGFCNVPVSVSGPTGWTVSIQQSDYDPQRSDVTWRIDGVQEDAQVGLAAGESLTGFAVRFGAEWSHSCSYSYEMTGSRGDAGGGGRCPRDCSSTRTKNGDPRRNNNGNAQLGIGADGAEASFDYE
jgi:hypothetical protein